MNYKEAEKNYKMLANQRHLRIIRFLAKKQRAPVREVAGEINLSFKATSKHLLLLKQIGFIPLRRIPCGPRLPGWHWRAGCHRDEGDRGTLRSFSEGGV